MEEMIKLIIGISFLLLGIPLGILLAKKTQEELKSRQKWFKIIIISSLIGGLIGLIIRNDVLFFSFFFMAIVTSRSLRKQ
jgi:NADH:ubiquinone oxidoreductase subunit 4 (subunit M)